jgi:hypothetical protein
VRDQPTETHGKAPMHCGTFIFFINILSVALKRISVFGNLFGDSIHFSAFLNKTERERQQWCFSDSQRIVKK